MSTMSLRGRLAAASLLILAAASDQALAAADLAPDAANLVTLGQAAVINQGDEASAPSHLTITCEKTGGAGGCAESPAMAAYEDPAYPDAAVIDVPALQPGESFVHALPFWAKLVWAAGTYELTLTADAGEAVDEDDESNNVASVQTKKLGNVGVAPIPLGPGTLTIVPAGGGQPGKLQFTLGQ